MPRNGLQGFTADTPALLTELAAVALSPGTTVWLEDGTYTLPAAGLDLSLHGGTVAAPVVVRPVPGAKPKIILPAAATTLLISGTALVFRDVRIQNTSSDRTTTRSDAVQFYGARSKLINCTISDGGDGIGSYPGYAQDSLIGGNIVFNGGWQANDGTDRGHGHDLYISNETGGSKLVRHNAFLQAYGFGIHGYSQVLSLNDMDWFANICALSGWLADKSAGRTVNHKDMIIEGVGNRRHTITRHYHYNTGPDGVGGADFGSISQTNDGLTVVGGRFALASATFGAIHNGAPWTNVSVTNTPVVDASSQQSPFVSPACTVNPFGSGPDAVYVEANPWERGRGHVVVYNFSHANTVSADLSSLLSVGDVFYVFDAMNPDAGPILSGTYSGSAVTIPMTSLTMATPIGGVAPAHPAPEFGVFLVRKVAYATGAPAPADYVAA